MHKQSLDIKEKTTKIESNFTTKANAKGQNCPNLIIESMSQSITGLKINKPNKMLFSSYMAFTEW